jgi:hypothetical protein
VGGRVRFVHRRREGNVVTETEWSDVAISQGPPAAGRRGTRSCYSLQKEPSLSKVEFRPLRLISDFWDPEL